MRELKAVKREALFFLRSDLGPKLTQQLIERYTFSFYEDKACEACEFRIERHSDVCDTCPAFKGGYTLAKKVKIKENPYLQAPLGDLPKLTLFLASQGRELKIVSKAPLRNIKPVTFTGTLRDFQGPAIKDLIQSKRGILKSLPRSGKTVMAAAAVCEVGMKTLILASQRDWLMGFHETFVGSKTQKPLTDLDPSRIGFARKYEEFLQYDICLSTVQTFRSEIGQHLLSRIRDKFSIIVVDEVHTSAADKYLITLSKLNVVHAWGLSGTPSRKDGRMPLTNAVLGPVVHTTSVERLKAMVKLVRTKYSRKVTGQMLWPYMVGHLEKDKARQKLIAEHAIRDMEAGHLVLIPMSQVKPIKTLIELINKLAGRKVAFPFYGSVKKEERDLTIERARLYKRKILVGNTKLLSTGINIPRASMLYDVSMSSNKENAEQRLSRILTPFDGKPQPVLKIFLDEMSVRKRCLANEWWTCFHPKFKPIISEVDNRTLQAYLKSANSREPEAIGQYL